MSVRLAIARSAAVLSLAAALAGCGERDLAPCSPGLPHSSELLGDPAFSALTYHRRVEYEARRGVAYDLWGDARFEYRTGLEFELVPVEGGRGADELCMRSVSLRFAEPASAATARPMLHALIDRVAAHSTLDASVLESRLAQLLEIGAPYGLAMRQGAIEVDAGRITHPSRGEFFVVSFSLVRS